MKFVNNFRTWKTFRPPKTNEKWYIGDERIYLVSDFIQVCLDAYHVFSWHRCESAPCSFRDIRGTEFLAVDQICSFSFKCFNFCNNPPVENLSVYVHTYKILTSPTTKSCSKLCFYKRVITKICSTKTHVPLFASESWINMVYFI